MQTATANVFKERMSVAFGGFAFFQILYSASKFDLFGYLKKSRKASLEKIGRDLGIPENSLRVLLMGCTYLGLTEKVGESYSITPQAEEFIRDSRDGAWPILNGLHSIVYPAMHSLSESLEAGTNVGLREIRGRGATLYRRLSGQPKLERVFHDWMTALSRTVGLNDSVLELLRPTLSQVEHLVDYGGGDATNAINMCRYYPHLRVTVFDSPSVCELARKKIRKAGMADRVFLREGDFLKDPFVRSVDGVMFNHIFNIYSKKTNSALLRKSRESLVKGGVAIIFNGISYDSEDGPAGATVLSAYFLGLATGEGMVYPLKDYDEWFEDAGFRNIKKLYIPEIIHGLVVAEK